MSEKKIRVAVNGFGRIGRGFVRTIYKSPELQNKIELVAINDLGDPKNLAYLLKYDSVYGRFPVDVAVSEKGLTIGATQVRLTAERDPLKLPWKELAVDVVVESTGIFETYEKAAMHVTAGARRVVVSAPGKGEGGCMVLMGINEFAFEKCPVSSNASCTTNAISPLMAILGESIGIEKAMLNTVHAYTATQGIVDTLGGKDLRRGRAAAHSIIPASTGAASALGKIMPALDGVFDGMSLRVPVLDGSIADVTFIAKRATTVEEVNEIMRAAAKDDRWKGLFSVVDEPIVSSDILGDGHASIADLSLTMVVGGNLVKVCAWYDNEAGYSSSLVSHVIKAGSY